MPSCARSQPRQISPSLRFWPSAGMLRRMRPGMEWQKRKSMDYALAPGGSGRRACRLRLLGVTHVGLDHVVEGKHCQRDPNRRRRGGADLEDGAVSYTHLTLPT